MAQSNDGAKKPPTAATNLIGSSRSTTRASARSLAGWLADVVVASPSPGQPEAAPA